METFGDPLLLPGLRPIESEPAVALLRLQALAGACPGTAKQEEDVDERDRGGSEERVRGGMEEKARRDGARDPGRRDHQQRGRPGGRGPRHVRRRQPVQQLASRLVDPFGVGRRVRDVGKAAQLGIELAKLGRDEAQRVERLVRGMDRLRAESNTLAGLAAQLASRPVARRRLLIRPPPHARELAFQVLQPGNPRAHVRGLALVERAPGKPGRGERAFGRAAIGLRPGKVPLRTPPHAAQTLQRLGLGAGEALHVRGKRRIAPFEPGPFAALFQKLEGLRHESRLAVRNLRLVQLAFQGAEPFLLALQLAVPALPVPEVRFGRGDLLRLRLSHPGRNGEAAFAAGGIEVVPAGHLTYQAPGDVGVGVGVGITRQQILDVEGVAGNEAVLRERRGLDPLPVPGPDEGGAGAGGLDVAFPPARFRPPCCLSPPLPTGLRARRRPRHRRSRERAPPRTAPRARPAECSSSRTHWVRRRR